MCHSVDNRDQDLLFHNRLGRVSALFEKDGTHRVRIWLTLDKESRDSVTRTSRLRERWCYIGRLG